MTRFNRQGHECAHPVRVPRDPTVQPTFSHPFPVRTARGIEERWAHRVRPIPDMTRILSGARLRRDQDYLIEYDAPAGEYIYWFRDSRWALMFQLAAVGRTCLPRQPQQAIHVRCPECDHQFHPGTGDWV